ncbi:hypothetical protein Bbelb_365200 [Branchiostoma belcheri]|nr:hypothetical protein Bbelb_365200 [Branchiostoma belcheri]
MAATTPGGMCESRSAYRLNLYVKYIKVHSTTQQRRKKRQDRARPVLAMNFVREGEAKLATARRDNSILQRANSWELRVDLDGKKIVMIELTVPWEEGCEEAHERKSAKYKTCCSSGFPSTVGVEDAVSCRDNRKRQEGSSAQDALDGRSSRKGVMLALVQQRNNKLETGRSG